jgi:hypothetical protein
VVHEVGSALWAELAPKAGCELGVSILHEVPEGWVAFSGTRPRARPKGERKLISDDACSDFNFRGVEEFFFPLLGGRGCERPKKHSNHLRRQPKLSRPTRTHGWARA